MRRRSFRLAVLPLAALLFGCGSEPRLDVREQPAPAGPRVIAVDPPNGATGVDPARTTLVATFDREMDPEGWAWVIENPATAPEIGESAWDPTTRVNTATVRLEPGRTYVVWLNSPQYLFFRDRAGVAAPPFRWSFTTAGGGGLSLPLVRSNSAPAAVALPTVTRLEPPAGATGVEPGVTTLRVTFDRPMAEGWSWVTDPVAPFPEMTGEASQSADGRSAALPVRLEPGRTYVVWLNSAEYQGFRDQNGLVLPPFRWELTTRPAE
ncbi:MAG: Ig-like domain-containing protein [Acidobacteriota bacterium]|jgi:RNA polymerase sigma-70 factor (ECF subfamily)|nr:Ig-like domain-containing protein [Acidobacteriota bacterium]